MVLVAERNRQRQALHNYLKEQVVLLHQEQYLVGGVLLSFNNDIADLVYQKHYAYLRDELGFDLQLLKFTDSDPLDQVKTTITNLNTNPGIGSVDLLSPMEGQYDYQNLLQCLPDSLSLGNQNSRWLNWDNPNKNLYSIADRFALEMLWGVADNFNHISLPEFNGIKREPEVELIKYPDNYLDQPAIDEHNPLVS